jgi:hypothetical chaperone protein
MNFFENPFTEELTQKEFNRVISSHTEKIKKTLDETIQMAGVSYNQIDKVFLTGGSTLVPKVNKIYKELFSTDKIIHTDVFSSVGYGLAIKATDF